MTLRPGPHANDPYRRVAKLLKYAKRVLALDCIDVRTEPPK